MKRNAYISNLAGKFALLLLMSTLVRCGSPTRNASEETIILSGVFSLGRVEGATIKAYILKSNSSLGDLLGTATTNSVGYWSMEVKKTSSAILIRATLGSYKDEATGNTITLQAGEYYDSILLSGELSRTVNITPLTHIGTQGVLEKMASGTELTSGLITSTLQSVGTAVGFGSTYDVRDVTPVDPTNSSAVFSATEQQKQYALFLAGLSQQANTLGVSQNTLIGAYVTDFSTDLTLDGLDSGAAISVGSGSLTSTSWSSGVRDGAATWQAGAQNTAGLPSVNFTGVPGLTDGSLSVTPSTTSRLALSWSGFGSGTASYKVVYATGSTAPADCSSGSLAYAGTATSLNHTALSSGTTYSYRICGVGANGTTMSPGVTGTNATITLTNGSVTNSASASDVNLSWSGFSAYAVSYRVVRGAGSFPADCASGTLRYAGTSTTYTDSGLNSQTDYYYRICAVDDAGNYSSGTTKLAHTQ